jgi:predicted transcriptional regulator of viral defense system
MTQPITARVKSKIAKLSDGVAFASNSFKFVNANQNSIEKELSRLNADGVIKRFRKGIYYKPQKSSLFGDVLPNPSAIAQAIAKLNHAHIVPDGSMALNMLGLSDQVPMKYIYLNDKLHKSEFVGNTEIVFKRINAKKLTTSNKRVGLVLSAINYLGKDVFNDKNLVKDFASKLDISDIKDLDMASKYYPLWVKNRVSEIIDEIY